MVNWKNVGDEAGRFTLSEDGKILWQENKTNPLPGDVVALIIKGDNQLSPKINLTEKQSNEVQKSVETWLQEHIKTILLPLFNLKDETTNKLEGVAKDIGDCLFDNLGVIHRNEIEKFIPELTPELRVNVRRKRIKMGPILVFMPELVKPAAINLRSLLWGLWNDKSLPMARPSDGRVSVTVDASDVDRNYFRSIGYPVFGNKAIRIDMLDRVVTDVYDSSKDGKFQAQHKQMEWLGCGEDDLYSILISMGFKRIKEDAVEIVNKEKIVEKTDKSDELIEKESETPVKEDVKPILASFWVKKGKISDKPVKKTPFKSEKTKKTDKKIDKSKRRPSKPTVKTYSAKPKASEIDNDSPFAILKQLQK